MPVTASHREQLARIRERTHNARTARQRARQTLDAARAAHDEDAIGVAALAVEQANVELETAEQLERMLLSSMAGVNGHGGPSVFDDPHTVETLQRLGSSSMPIGRLDLGPLSSREDLVAQIQSGSWHSGRYGAAGDVQVPDSARVGTPYGVVPQLRRPLSLLDLIPSQTMDARSFSYMQEGGSFDGAAETAEGAMKPMADLTLTEAEVVAATIAAWTKLKRAQLDDVPALATTVQTRLTYSVLRRLENQILAGDGTGENILGILHTPGIDDVPFVADTPLTDLSLDAITAVALQEATPNGVVLNPADIATMLKAKTTTGERLDSEGAFGADPQTLWGLPRIASTVIAPGYALVADFTQATVFIREPVNVRLSDADQDDFVKNRLTMLGECRAGLAVWQPGAFAVVHFAAAPPLRSGQKHEKAS